MTTSIKLQEGRGITDFLYNKVRTIADSVLKPDPSINKLMKGEKHGILSLPSGKFAYAQYLGPGTKVNIRVSRGEMGLTPIDTAAKGHDLRYRLIATDARNSDEARMLARKADLKFNSVIDKLKRTKKDSLFNLKQAELIKAKVFLEKKSTLFHKLSSSYTANEDEDDDAITKKYRKTLKSLEQKGYGFSYTRIKLL